LGSTTGGYGIPITPQVVCKNIDIVKTPLVTNVDYRVMTFPEYPESVEEERKSVEEWGGWINSPFSHVYPVSFLKEQYSLAISQEKNILYILKAEKHVKSIAFARYGIMTRALEWKVDNKSYLVVFVNLQATSNSSVLIILDDKMDVVYEEYLTRAEALGEGVADDFGPFIAIKSRNIFVPPGPKSERIHINGDWIYYLKSEAIGDKFRQTTNPNP
jgi:hypothetical protein